MISRYRGGLRWCCWPSRSTRRPPSLCSPACPCRKSGPGSAWPVSSSDGFSPTATIDLARPRSRNADRRLGLLWTGVAAMPTGRPPGRGAAAAYVVDVAEGEPVPGQRLHRRQPEDAPPAKQTTESEMRGRKPSWACANSDGGSAEQPAMVRVLTQPPSSASSPPSQGHRCRKGARREGQGCWCRAAARRR